jgi:hypothetical protein
MSRESNPFATRFTRPGAIAYLFAKGESATALVARLAEQGWWGEIVGPHGSGKSTLLAELGPALAAAGRKVAWRQIGLTRADGGDWERAPVSGVRKVPPRFAAVTAGSEFWNETTQVVLDGYEQLSWWWRRRVQALCRRRGAGLLVTAHEPLGLPPLVRTQPSEKLAQQVVAKLLADVQSPVTAADVREAFARTGGNVRETLFALYDVHREK